MFEKLNALFESFDFEKIPEDRKWDLQPLIAYIQSKHNDNETIRLNFICTHNSRRSHLAQVWAQTSAARFGIKNVFCYSGGTEATAMFPMVAETLQSAGFQLNKISEGSNPIFSIKYSKNEHPVIGFSKTYAHDFNPSTDFAAILTCTQADKGCPFIAGAEMKISLPFDDPKAFDNTPIQAKIYEDRSLQIALEMAYVFSQI
ncbi:MAG TPA: protein-tyrosine-phosphatase [Catalimonadaceae bacterium]|nr:protein-tyrosine-phosphatase [Catalimonadaceae bacterium]